MKSVGAVVRALFPNGTSLGQAGVTPDDANWEKCPIFPPDLFAIAGKLIELSGAYHHIVPTGQPEAEPQVDRQVRIGSSDVRWARRYASVWRQNGRNPPVPSQVEKEWAALMRCEGDRLFVMLKIDKPRPRWWKHAVRLLMVADEASVGIGYFLGSDGDVSASWVDYLPSGIGAPRNYSKVSGAVHYAKEIGDWTFSSADPNIACVLPKVRTSGVGCSMRSLSHNLALLPPSGITRVWWLDPWEPRRKVHRPLNVVLIPFPYQISARCFRQGGLNETHGWGWFEVHQRWLGARDGVSSEEVAEAIADFLIGIVEAADRDVGEIHGVVMPELALDHATFRAVAEKLGLSKIKECLEFFVCGTSGNEQRKGNFACTATYTKKVGPDGVVAQPWFDDRQKHHRWRLDRYQISRYGLTSALDPAYLWWEHIPILSRSITMQQIRSGSVYTSLICEDLARVDPCQEALRSIGPNLVFALLMDGPQLHSRWPGRYATVLAEDPGSSVLTLTSLGLIERANESGGDPPSRVIALWKDVDINHREIKLDPASLAVCITLNVREEEEFTLDGRSDGRAAPVWTLGSLKQIPRLALPPFPAWIETCP